MTRYGPELTLVAENRAACVASYEDFLSKAHVERFESSGFHVDVSGNTATASYRWEVGYEIDGAHAVDRGRDVLVLRQTDNGWVVCWRAMLPDAAADDLRAAR